MKIIDNRDPLKRVLDVYGIYWVNGVRYHYVIPVKDYFGFSVVHEREVQLVDRTIDDFVIIETRGGRDVLLHWAAEKDALLDKLTDPPNQEAVAELHRRIREYRSPSR